MLRREFGIGAFEAEDEIFGFERDMLIRLYVEASEGKGRSSEDSGDLSVVPSELRGL